VLVAANDARSRVILAAGAQAHWTPARRPAAESATADFVNFQRRIPFARWADSASGRSDP